MSRGAKKDGNDEVEELLKASQDELLLKLTVDSHMSRVSPSYIDPDLDARFQALKKKPSSSSQTKKKDSAFIAKSAVGEEKTSDDDLLARFAALKGSSGSSSSSAGVKLDAFDQGKSDPKDEVDKLIQWAIDAARLDPSPPSDEDFGDDDEDDEFDSDENESDDEDVPKKKKESDKSKLRK